MIFFDKHDEYRNSIEFQAAHTIWEKYKRSSSLTFGDFKALQVLSYSISEVRKRNNKKVNLDLLIQELGKTLKRIQ